MNFFNQYNRFVQTTGFGNSNSRLNSRYLGIIQWNCELIKDKTILDIGAHDGRWTFAAIKAGAKHVTCIEPRNEHVQWIHDNMEHYNAKNYSVIQDDIHQIIGSFEPNQFDVIFCLGFFYHTLEHKSLLKEFKRLSPKTIIMDTNVASGDNSFIQLEWESTSKPLFSIGENQKNLVGRPSIKALQDMFESIMYDIEFYDWSKIHNISSDYSKKTRVTLRATKQN